MRILLHLNVFVLLFGTVVSFTPPAITRPVPFTTTNNNRNLNHLPLFGATELPDSLADAAVRAAEASAAFSASGGTRCRVDFDTSVGDETYTLLKSSTEFMQEFVSATCYAMIPGLQSARQSEMIKVMEAESELKQLEDSDDVNEEREAELIAIIERRGRTNDEFSGPVARVYFPDEGSAALARRDWDNVPACCQFSSCGGVQMHDFKDDQLVFFFCPRASEAESVEEILALSEQKAENLKLTIFVNPNLVDMGVTGFGMAGRMLRERLIDTLMQTYYLRTLAWGALTRKYPDSFSVYQEDANVEGGYRLIKLLEYLPSNPEVEDIYDIENGLKSERESGGILDQFGDFVNGMMKL